MTQVNNAPAQSGIIDKLIQQNTSKPVTAPVQKATVQVPLSQPNVAPMRVVSARYRVYSLLLFLLLVVLWYNYLLPTYDTYTATHTQLADTLLKVTSFDATRKQYEANKSIVDIAEKKQSDVLVCLNSQQGCTSLPDLIKNNIALVRSYLQLQTLDHPKMPINEKLLLTNINEYLLKTSISDSSKWSNWILRKLTIWEKEVFNDHISYVPIQLTVTFINKDGLLSFINNVEKYIVPEAWYRVLYKIDKISYNIVDYTQPQDAEIFMYAYSYN